MKKEPLKLVEALSNELLLVLQQTWFCVKQLMNAKDS